MAIPTSTPFSWSKSLGTTRSVNLDFNSLAGLNPGGIFIPSNGKGTLFNLDDIIGSGSTTLPVLGVAGLKVDLDATLGYDYGMRLDLGKASATLSAGVDLKIDGTLPNIFSNQQSDASINLDLKIKPIQLDWGVSSPAFKAWAYLLYSAGIDLDWYYRIFRWGDSGDIFSARKSGKVGNEIGFDSASFTGKVGLTDGFDFKAGTSIQGVIPTPSPSWSKDILPYINLSLFTPALPKPSVSKDGVGFSSKFPVLKLSGDVDKALSDFIGVPFSGDISFDLGIVDFAASWELVDIKPTLQLDALYDVGFSFDIDKIDIYNNENPASKIKITTLNLDQVSGGFKDSANAITAAISSADFKDLNTNGQYDFELVWEPKINFNVKAGFEASAYVDWAALKAELNVGWDIDLWLTSISGNSRNTIGPLLAGKIDILKPREILLLNESKNITNLSVIPESLKRMAAPLSIPRAINDPFNLDLNLSLGLSDIRKYEGQLISAPLPKNATPDKIHVITAPSYSSTNLFRLELSALNTKITNQGFFKNGPQNDYTLSLPNLEAGENGMPKAWDYELRDLNGTLVKLYDMNESGLRTQHEKSDLLDVFVDRYDQEGNFVTFLLNRPSIDGWLDGSFLSLNVGVMGFIALNDNNDRLTGGFNSKLFLRGGSDHVILTPGVDLNYTFKPYNPRHHDDEWRSLILQHDPNPFLHSTQYNNKYGYLNLGSGSDWLEFSGAFSSLIESKKFTGSEGIEIVLEIDDQRDNTFMGYDFINLSDYQNPNSFNVVRMLGGKELFPGADIRISVNYNNTLMEENPVISDFSVGENSAINGAKLVTPKDTSTGFLYLVDYSNWFDPSAKDQSQGIAIHIDNNLDSDFMTCFEIDYSTPYPVRRGGAGIAHSSIGLIGSQLNDRFVIKDNIFAVEGMHGNDTYELASPFIASNSRALQSAYSSRTGETALGNLASVPVSSGNFRSSFIYDPYGHSSVTISSPFALFSFYEYGADIIDLGVVNILASKGQLNYDDQGLLTNFDEALDLSDLPTWSLKFDGVSVDSRELWNSYRGRRLPQLKGASASFVQSTNYVEAPREIVFSRSGNYFDPAHIWQQNVTWGTLTWGSRDSMISYGYQPIQKYFSDFSILYRLAPGDQKDIIYGFSDRDIFDVSSGPKNIIDRTLDDDDTLILHKYIGSLDFKVIDNDGLRSYEIRDKGDTSDGSLVSIQGIENIAFDLTLNENTETIVTYKVNQFFSDLPLLVRGLPSDRLAQWQAGDQGRRALLKKVITVLPSAIAPDGSLTIATSILTSALQSLDGTKTLVGNVEHMRTQDQNESVIPESAIKVEVGGGLIKLMPAASRPLVQGDVSTFEYQLIVGDKTFSSTLILGIISPQDGQSLLVMKEDGTVRDETGKEILSATTSPGAVITGGALVRLTDQNNDSKIRGDDLSFDLNQDGVVDALPGGDILQTELFDIRVSLQPQHTQVNGAVTLNIELANPVVANEYRKFFNGKWNNFLFNPLAPERGGAELFDRNRDGLVESIALHLFDGGPGDSDGERNGQIVDPGILVESQGNSVASIIDHSDKSGKIGLYELQGRQLAISDPFLLEKQRPLDVVMLRHKGKPIVPPKSTVAAVKSEGVNYSLVSITGKKLGARATELQFNAAGVQTSAKSVASANLFAMELSYGQDLNGDGMTGDGIAKVLDNADTGGVRGLYGLTSGGLAVSGAQRNVGDVPLNSDLVRLTHRGQPVSAGPVVTVSALKINGDGSLSVLRVIGRGSKAGGTELQFNATGVQTSAKRVASANLFAMELSYGQDLNGDGMTGDGIAKVLDSAETGGVRGLFGLSNGGLAVSGAQRNVGDVPSDILTGLLVSTPSQHSRVVDPLITSPNGELQSKASIILESTSHHLSELGQSTEPPAAFILNSSGIPEFGVLDAPAVLNHQIIQ